MLTNENESYSRGNNVDLNYYNENNTAIFTLKAQIGTIILIMITLFMILILLQKI